MKFNKRGINRFGYVNGRNRKKIFLKWLCLSLILLLFYMVMCSGAFKKSQPMLIIPYAIAVSMNAREISGSLFGIFCGFAVDMACGNLFGMSSVWLMPCCLFTVLLSMHLIRVNFFNHLWISLLTCFIMAFMDYFFNYFIWDIQDSIIILTDYILPSYIMAVVFAPAVYFLTKAVNNKFNETVAPIIEERVNADEDDIRE